MMKILVFSVVIILISYYWRWFIPKHWYSGRDDIDEFLRDNGYPLETHNATTEDGYVLTLHRIPHGRNKAANNAVKKPPVLMMHGLLCSSMDWVILGRGKAMALILADAGYDVWLGNNRGNTYSRNHISMDPDRDEQKFYDYSYHKIGIYDLPAMIDAVLNATGYSKLTYLGYSEGFTSFTVMGSYRPEYNEKVLIMNAFAPVTNMYNITSIWINVLAKYRLLSVAKAIGWYEMFSHRGTNGPLRLLSRFFKPLLYKIFQILGSSKEQLDEDFIETIVLNFPAGMSLKQITHYVQGTQTGTYRPFDYGEAINIKVYGSPFPPSYNLSKVTAPIILYYGEADSLINNEILINSVAKQLPNVVKSYLVPYRNFNHLDFIWGKNISLLTDEALKNIRRYNMN